MSNLVSIHPEDIVLKFNSRVPHARYTYTNNIHHFFQEFYNDPNIKSIYAGAVPGPEGINIHTISVDILRKYLLEIITPDMKIVFDDMHEGIFFNFLVHRIHTAIKDTDINPAQIYYFSCTINSNELYKRYREVFNITNPINVYCCNLWEYAILNNGDVRDRYNIIKNKEKLFLCFNRMFKVHRYALLGLLLEKDLVKNSYYSFFFNNYSEVDITIDEAEVILNHAFSKGISNIIDSAIRNNIDLFPLKINIENSNNKNYLDKNDVRFFDNSYFSLVTETSFNQCIGYCDVDYHIDLLKDNTIFFSEKIYKPIVMRHPFILMSAAHSLKYLKKIGYKTFSPYINEMYDDIEDHETRMMAIVDEIERLSKFTDDEWIRWQHDVEHIVDHNHMIIRTRKINEYAVSRPDYKTQP